MEISKINLSPTVWDVLFINDDQDDFLLTRSSLSDLDGNRIRLHWAGSYEAGMLALADNHLDAAFVDYYLAERNGQDLIRKAVQIGHNLLFILLTGLNRYELDIAAMQAGASDYLLKGD